MITIEDCEAFCEAEPAVVRELACSERLTMVQAYALAHEAKRCSSPAHRSEFGEASRSRAIVETV